MLHNMALARKVLTELEGIAARNWLLVAATHGRCAANAVMVRSSNNRQGSSGKHEGVPKGSLNPTEKKRGKQKKRSDFPSRIICSKSASNPLLNRFHTSNIRIIYLRTFVALSNSVPAEASDRREMPVRREKGKRVKDMREPALGYESNPGFSK